MAVFANDGLLPEVYRALNDGVLSVCVNRFGGVEELGWLNGPVVDGVEYYDPFVRKLLSRSCGTSGGRPLFGPALRFLSEDRDGRMIEHYPANPDCRPWALQGGDARQKYLLLLDRQSLLMRFSCRQGRIFHLVISREHLVPGPQDALPNIWNDDFNRPYHEELKRQDEGMPFANGSCSVKWGAPEVSRDRQRIVWNITLAQPWKKETLYAVLAADRPFEFSENPRQWGCHLPWTAGSLKLALSFGREPGETARRASLSVEKMNQIVRRKFQKGERLSAEAPRVLSEALPSAEKFFRASAVYQQAMLLPGGGIRAAAHKYGYYAMWDAIFPIRDFLWTGQYDLAEKIWDYTAFFPSIEVSPFAASQLILAFSEIRSHEPDKPVSSRHLARIRELFETAARFADRERGLVRTLNACGVDRPAELGLSGFFFASCVNAWWYEACRVVENLAIENRDRKLEAQAHDLVEKIHRYYLPVFWNREEGFLTAGVPVTDAPFIPVCHNSATIGLEYNYGFYLFQEVIPELSRYLSRKLCHPMGHSAVAWNSPVPCEMWRYVHMNQHLAHECKLLRQAGETDEIRRTLQGYLREFDRYQVAQETFNFNGCEGNESQTANWQTFSASSAAEALRFGIMGIGRHAAGWFYQPAPDTGSVSVQNVKFGSRRLNFQMHGTGEFAEIRLNGRRIRGTMQVSWQQMAGFGDVIQVDIRRVKRMPENPVLLNSFGGLVRLARTDAGCLALEVLKDGAFPVEIWAPAEPRALVNGRAVPGTWNAVRKRFYLDSRWTAGDRLEFQITG